MLKTKALPALGALAVILFASSCTLSRPTQEARVEIAFAPRDPSSDGLWSRLSRSLSRSPVRTESEWLTLPDAWQEFDCLGLHVSGSGISAETSALPSRSTCTGGTVSLVEPGLIGGLISTATGGSISLAIPLGGARKVQVFGLKTRDGSCPVASSLFGNLGERTSGATHLDGAGDAATGDWPMLLAETTVELTQDTTLSLTPEFTRSAPEPVFCDGTGTEVSVSASVSALSLDGVPLADIAADPGAHESILDDDQIIEEYTFVIELDRRLSTELTPAHFSLGNASSQTTISAVTRLNDFSYAIQVTSTVDLTSSASDIAGPVTLSLNSGVVRDIYGRLLGGFTQGMDQAFEAYLASLGLSPSDMDSTSGASGSSDNGLPNFGGYSIDAAGSQVYGPTSPIYTIGPCSNGVERLTITQSDGNGNTSTYGPFPCPSASPYSSHSEGNTTSPLPGFASGSISLKMDGSTAAGTIVASSTEVYYYDKTPPTVTVLQADYSAGVFRLRIEPDDIGDINLFTITIMDHLGAFVGTSTYNQAFLASSLTAASSQTLNIAVPSATAMGGTYSIVTADSVSNQTHLSSVEFNLPARPPQRSAHGDGFNCHITSDNSTIRCGGNDTHGQLGQGSAAPAAYPSPTAGVYPTLASGEVELKRVAGTAHTCVLRDADGDIATNHDRSVWCWGAGDEGQLGVSGAGGAPPTSVSASDIGTDIIDLVAGDQFTCVLKAAGSVLCWGRGDAGQLGQGAYANSSTPVAVLGLNTATTLTGATTLAAGANHVCAGGANILTAAGTATPQVVCWGSNNLGQIGSNPAGGSPVSMSSTPMQVPSLTAPDELDAGENFTCAHNTGTPAVYCWGDNSQQQLGAGSAIFYQHTPYLLNVGPNLSKVVTGASFGCGLASSSSQVYCWGQGTSGQLGNNALNNSSTPVQVLSFNGGGTASVLTTMDISAGSNHACALVAATGPVKCWGMGQSAQLGRATQYIHNSKTAEFAAVPTGDSLASLNLFRDSSIVRTGGGSAYFWGGNSYYGSLAPRERIVPLANSSAITISGESFAQVTAGDTFACARTASGKVYCWGANEDGQLGTNTSGDSSTPTQILTLGSNVSQIQAASQTACAIYDGGASPGGVRCWGANSSSNLGNSGVTTPYSASPVDVLDGGGIAITQALGLDVLAGGACAVKHTGQLVCWGDAGFGGSSSSATLKVVADVVQFGAGTPRACVVLVDGTLQCWGNNNRGGAVPGNASSSIVTPTTVSGLTDVRQVTHGHGHTCALTGSGAQSRIYCWGQWWDGQLGGYTGGSAPSSPDVGSWTQGATSISAGVYQTCAAFSDGTFDCAGGVYGLSPVGINP